MLTCAISRCLARKLLNLYSEGSPCKCQPCKLRDSLIYDIMYRQVRLCPRVDAHAWRLCPFAHPGERERRRCPSSFSTHQSTSTCPTYRQARSIPRREAPDHRCIYIFSHILKGPYTHKPIGEKVYTYQATHACKLFSALFLVKTWL